MNGIFGFWQRNRASDNKELEQKEPEEKQLDDVELEFADGQLTGEIDLDQKKKEQLKTIQELEQELERMQRLLPADSVDPLPPSDIDYSRMDNASMQQYVNALLQPDENEVYEELCLQEQETVHEIIQAEEQPVSLINMDSQISAPDYTDDQQDHESPALDHDAGVRKLSKREKREQRRIRVAERKQRELEQTDAVESDEPEESKLCGVIQTEEDSKAGCYSAENDITRIQSDNSEVPVEDDGLGEQVADLPELKREGAPELSSELSVAREFELVREFQFSAVNPQPVGIEGPVETPEPVEVEEPAETQEPAEIPEVVDVEVLEEMPEIVEVQGSAETQAIAEAQESVEIPVIEETQKPMEIPEFVEAQGSLEVQDPEETQETSEIQETVKTQEPVETQSSVDEPELEESQKIQETEKKEIFQDTVETVDNQEPLEAVDVDTHPASKHTPKSFWTRCFSRFLRCKTAAVSRNKSSVNVIEGLIEGDVLGENIILERRSLVKSDVIAGKRFYSKTKSVVFGNVYAGEAVIEGTVRGNIEASRSVRIKDNGCVFGNVTAPAITLDSKGYIAGNLIYGTESKK